MAEPEPLVTITELAARLPFELDADETREAEGAIADLSDDARLYGKPGWLSPAVTPVPVKNLILKAAGRHMKNHDGYTTSRAGDETVAWTDRGHDAGSAYFTDRELKALRAMANHTAGLYSVEIIAWHQPRPPQRREGLVATQEPNRPFPLFNRDDSPW
ncbi:hypothetical protein [Kribbella deserti]|uniref:Head-to-tail adaptor n=1 Tax=Kribbella deserti TaxID=1926257 RepID=A0ABV6QFN7_9ACTN